MREHEIVVAALEEDVALTLEELCATCAVTREWVVTRVEEGLLPIEESGAAEWRFGGRQLRRAREMHRIERTFDAAPELAALVADLLEEIEALRARLRS
jgi:chaperone modulatory protein CbpM